jgi:hypothetical protein
LIASPILIIAIVAALALSGTVAVTTVTITLLQQQAQAAKSPMGQCASTIKNATGRDLSSNNLKLSSCKTVYIIISYSQTIEHSKSREEE